MKDHQLALLDRSQYPDRGVGVGIPVKAVSPMTSKDQHNVAASAASAGSAVHAAKLDKALKQVDVSQVNMFILFILFITPLMRHSKIQAYRTPKHHAR